MPAREGKFGHVNADEARATEQQYLEWLAGFRVEPSWGARRETGCRCGCDEVASMHAELAFELLTTQYTHGPALRRKYLANGR